MYIKIELPDEEGKELLKIIEEKCGLKQIDEDWCTFKRKNDNARLDISPCPEPKDPKVGW
jgi:hypothetical protein